MLKRLPIHYGIAIGKGPLLLQYRETGSTYFFEMRNCQPFQKELYTKLIDDIYGFDQN